MATGLPILGEPVPLNALEIRQGHGFVQPRRSLQRDQMLRCIHTGKGSSQRPNRLQPRLQIRQPHREGPALLSRTASSARRQCASNSRNREIVGVDLQATTSTRVPSAGPSLGGVRCAKRINSIRLKVGGRKEALIRVSFRTASLETTYPRTTTHRPLIRLTARITGRCRTQESPGSRTRPWCSRNSAQ